MDKKKGKHKFKTNHTDPLSEVDIRDAISRYMNERLDIDRNLDDISINTVVRMLQKRFGRSFEDEDSKDLIRSHYNEYINNLNLVAHSERRQRVQQGKSTNATKPSPASRSESPFISSSSSRIFSTPSFPSSKPESSRSRSASTLTPIKTEKMDPGETTKDADKKEEKMTSDLDEEAYKSLKAKFESQKKASAFLHKSKGDRQDISATPGPSSHSNLSGESLNRSEEDEKGKKKSRKDKAKDYEKDDSVKKRGSSVSRQRNQDKNSKETKGSSYKSDDSLEEESSSEEDFKKKEKRKRELKDDSSRQSKYEKRESSSGKDKKRADKRRRISNDEDEDDDGSPKIKRGRGPSWDEYENYALNTVMERALNEGGSVNRNYILTSNDDNLLFLTEGLSSQQTPRSRDSIIQKLARKGTKNFFKDYWNEKFSKDAAQRRISRKINEIRDAKIKDLVDRFKRERQKKIAAERNKEISGFFKEGVKKIQRKFLKNMSDNSLQDDSDIVETDDDCKKKNKKLTKKRSDKRQKDSDSDSDIENSGDAVRKTDKNDRKSSTHGSKKDADSHSDVVCAENDVKKKKYLHTNTSNYKSKEKLDSEVVHGDEDGKTKKITKNKSHKTDGEGLSGIDNQPKGRKEKAASDDEKSNEVEVNKSNTYVEMDDEIFIEESDKSASGKASGNNVPLCVILSSSSDEEKAEKADESSIGDLLSDRAEESLVTSGIFNDDGGENETLTNSMENYGHEVIQVDKNDKNDVIEDEGTPTTAEVGLAALASAPIENYESNTFLGRNNDALIELNRSLMEELQNLKATVAELRSRCSSSTPIVSTQNEESCLSGSSANLPSVEAASEVDVSRDTTQCLQSADSNLNMQNSGTDAVAKKCEDEALKDSEEDENALPEKQTSSASDTIDVQPTSANESMNVGFVSSSGESILRSDGEVLVEQILSDVIGDATKSASDVVANVASATHEHVDVEKQSGTISRQQMLFDFGLNNSNTDIGCGEDDYEGEDLDIAIGEEVDLNEKSTKEKDESGNNEESSNTCATDAGRKDGHNNDTSSDDDDNNRGFSIGFRSPSPQKKVLVEKIETYEPQKNDYEKKKYKESEKKSCEKVERLKLSKYKIPKISGISRISSERVEKDKPDGKKFGAKKNFRQRWLYETYGVDKSDKSKIIIKRLHGDSK